MNYGLLYGGRIQPYDVIEFFGSAVFHEMVWQAETDDLGMEVVVCHILNDGRSESTPNDAVLDGDDAATAGTHLLQDVLVDRLEEAHVIVYNRQSFFPQLADNLRHNIA